NLNPGNRASSSASASERVGADPRQSSVTVSAPFVYDRSNPGIRTCMRRTISADLDGVDVGQIPGEAFPGSPLVATSPHFAARGAEVNAHRRGRVRGSRLPLHRP